MKLIETKVCFEDYYTNFDPNLIYNCYIDAECNGWNGWACPYFEKSVRDKFIDKQIQECSSEDAEFLQQLLDVEPQVINGMTLYDMSCGLCWDIEDEDFQKKQAELLTKEEKRNEDN
ncbi:MAG: hypothetical protein CM15mV64_200 [uncultured marine virus]|nr:MAG: hypothetical protein CM15mV64_200 [uncultured marine virus]|tara:strand:- start:8269 stop:8619 length:351 start_codon:yes stop_codon:yes gene_type:complete